MFFSMVVPSRPAAPLDFGFWLCTFTTGTDSGGLGIQGASRGGADYGRIKRFLNR